MENVILSELNNEELSKLKTEARYKQFYYLLAEIRQEESKRGITIVYAKRYSVVIETMFNSKKIFETDNYTEIIAYYKKANLILTKWRNYYQGKFNENKHRYIQLNEIVIKINKLIK